MTLTEALKRIEELESTNSTLTAENKSLKEDVEITEAALHREVEEHAKSFASMRKFFYKNVALTACVRKLEARNAKSARRLKSIEEHLLYVYIHSTLDAEAELRKPEGYFSKTFYNIKVTESLEAEANLINFFSYDYFQLRRMVTLLTLD